MGNNKHFKASAFCPNLANLNNYVSAICSILANVDNFVSAFGPILKNLNNDLVTCAMQSKGTSEELHLLPPIFSTAAIQKLHNCYRFLFLYFYNIKLIIECEIQVGLT